MTEAIWTTVALSVLGIGLRLWFTYAGIKAMRGPQRGTRQDHDDYGLSFDERVAKRLAEMPRE